MRIDRVGAAHGTLERISSICSNPQTFSRPRLCMLHDQFSAVNGPPLLGLLVGRERRLLACFLKGK